VGRVETIRNREGVEYRADVSQMKLSRASVQVNSRPTFRDAT
jgi:hypothetical protein